METGFKDLDEVIDLEKNRLILLCSRPEVGKNTLCLNIVTNVANKGTVVAIFNVETPKEIILKRIGNDVENIYIDDSINIKISEIEERCRNLKKEKDIKLVIINYLEVIDSEGQDISEKLSNLAKELNITIILLSQLPAELDARYYLGADPKPKLSDVEKTVVQQADVVMFLYRDDYYNPNSEMKNIAEVIVAKNKYGNCGTVELIFLEKYFKFDDLENRFDEETELSFKQKLKCIKEYTNLLNSININEVKQLEKNYWNKDIYILLKNGELYINGVLKEGNIESLYIFDENIHIYKIKKDNTIVPMKNEKYWDNLDIYLFNNNKPYRKIITTNSSIVALTLENKVVSMCFFEFLGIIPENFIDVDDIFIKDNRTYILKEGKEIPLYVTIREE